MVKKQQKTAGPKQAKGRRKDAAGAAPTAADTPFAEQVRASAQQIWSAGLQAFAKAQDQGGAVLDKVRAAETKVDTAAHRMSDMANEVGSRAGQHWDKLESIFEDRVARALARMGMPSVEEVAKLQARVESLTAEVAMLRAAHAGKTAAPTAKTPASKTTAKTPKKPAAPKKTATRSSAKATTRKS
ncbi:phasin family protein [Mitsuaria sp. GD03876]|uniref:phasin family protein n=1 Tax=Mitsuaria sp. GD03876 TaxID=2975399 RepID=UPI00244CE118|nr:phasin family protein [Mitsuaria sp. GD03876]MDH0863218.1 phasin family protein [Mitsuaria sp. GD03876]